MEVTEVRSRRALSSGVECQECQGHQAPTSCHYQRGTGKGGAGVRHQGVGARDLWSQAQIQFAERIDLPFPFSGLWHSHKYPATPQPPAPTPHPRSCIRSSSSHYPFGFAAGCGRTQHMPPLLPRAI